MSFNNNRQLHFYRNFRCDSSCFIKFSISCHRSDFDTQNSTTVLQTNWKDSRSETFDFVFEFQQCDVMSTYEVLIRIPTNVNKNSWNFTFFSARFICVRNFIDTEQNSKTFKLSAFSFLKPFYLRNEQLFIDCEAIAEQNWYKCFLRRNF